MQCQLFFYLFHFHSRLLFYLQHYNEPPYFKDVLMWLNIAFTILYMLEAGLKFFALRWVGFVHLLLHAVPYPETSGFLASGWSSGDTLGNWLLPQGRGDQPLAKEPEDSGYEIRKRS